MLRKNLILLFIIGITGCQSANKSVSIQELPTVIVSATVTALTATRAPATPMPIPPFLISSPTHTQATSTPTAKPENFFTPTRTPIYLTPTLIPISITLKRRLDVPIGGYYKFVIHKSKDSEDLEYYAKKYNTTVEAILYINYRLTNPAWEDVLFVVPVNIVDVSKLPIFVVYQIKPEEEYIPPDRLAAVLNVNPFDLKYYNGMLEGTEVVLRPGELILVPWSRPVHEGVWQQWLR